MGVSSKRFWIVDVLFFPNKNIKKIVKTHNTYNNSNNTLIHVIYKSLSEHPRTQKYNYDTQKDPICSTYHPRHGCWGVIGVEIGGAPNSLFLDYVSALVRRSGGYHVVGRVRGVAAPARGRWGVRCNFWGMERRGSSWQGHAWNEIERVLRLLR